MMLSILFPKDLVDVLALDCACHEVVEVLGEQVDLSTCCSESSECPDLPTNSPCDHGEDCCSRCACHTAVKTWMHSAEGDLLELEKIYVGFERCVFPPFQSLNHQPPFPPPKDACV